MEIQLGALQWTCTKAEHSDLVYQETMGQGTHVQRASLHIHAQVWGIATVVPALYPRTA